MIVLSDDVENEGFPVVNLILITSNVLMFMWMFMAGPCAESFYRDWGVVPARFMITHDAQQLLTILSSMFMHGGFLHLIGNMWALYLFGDNVEDRLGHFTYLLFYLACGFFADAIHILSDPSSTLPCVGASGAIAGVMGAYIALHPAAKCNTWWGDDSIFFAFRTFKIPAVVIIGGWFVLNLILGALTSTQHSGGIAFFAHIGGFLAGLAMLMALRIREYKRPDELVGVKPSVCIMSIMSIVGLSLMVSYFVNSSKAAVSYIAPSQETAAPQIEKSAKETEKPQDKTPHTHARAGHHRHHARQH